MVKILLNPETNLQDNKSTGLRINVTQEDLNSYKNRRPSGVSDYSPYDSMNFTNIYKDDISKYSNYNVPTTRYFNWDEERAQNQGTGEKWVNGLAKAGATTIGAIAENTLGIAFGIGELVTGGAYYDNFIGRSVDKWNEAMREALPNYRTQQEQEMSTLQKLGTANFWADTVANGFGYSIGSLATAYLTGGVGLLGRGVKSMQLYNVSKSVANAGKVADAVSKGNRMTGISNMLIKGEVGLYMSMAEASVEARETQKNVYNSLVELAREQKIQEGLSPELSQSELKDIENTSYAAGNRNFLTQLPALMGTNLFMFGKQVAGYKPASKYKNKDIAFDAAANKVVANVGNQGIYRNAIQRLKPLAKGSAAEAGQEGWQFASNIISSDFHTDKYFDAGTANFTSSLYKAIKETLGSQEGLESMLVGGLVGGGMSGVTSTYRGDFKNRVEAANKAADVINGGFLKNANESVGYFNAQSKVATDMENARQAGNHKAFKDAQFKLIQYNALATLKNGTFDVFMQKLEDSKDLNDKDFAALFGYDPDVALKDQTEGKSKSEVIKNVQDKLNKFKEVYENINERFPTIPPSMGVSRLRMSEQERKAEDLVVGNRNALREELILTASGIENRTERMQNIQQQIKDVIQAAERLNGIKLDTDIDLLFNPGEDLLYDKDGKYSPMQEAELIDKSLIEIQKELVKKNALAALIPLQTLIADYSGLFKDNSMAIDRYNKLSSSKYFQDLFNETVKANQAEAEQANKDKQTKEDIDNAETSDQVNESVPPDASGATKVDAKAKARALRQEEQAAVKKYLNLNPNKSIKERLKTLQHIAATNKDLSPTERKGLEIAIKNLDNKIKKGKTNKTKPQVIDEDLSSELTMTEDNIERTENDNKIAAKAPKKRKVVKPSTEPTDKSQTGTKPTTTGQLNVVSATNPNEVVNVGTEEDPNYKVPVDENGRVIEPDADTIDDKPIVLQPDLLLSETIMQEDVEFEIIENDWWKSGEFRDPAFTEDWMHIPIYYKIGNAYVGKLEASTNEDRKAIVDKLLSGRPVTTRISKIQANNFNNTVNDTMGTHFHNPHDTFGEDNDILLAFTTVTNNDSNFIYQWTLSDVSDDKNKNGEIDLINVQVQKDISPNSRNQIGIVIKKENNPAGVARISIASTANLSQTAQDKVLELLANKNFELPKQIVANSTLRQKANEDPLYLEFGVFPNGDNFIVYASPTLGKLIRINENELKKALDGTGNSTFNIVKESDEKFEGPKGNAKELNLNITEDLAAFLATKKYHVDRELGNQVGPYTSPVHPQNVYDSYQHYLFASEELGNAEREDGSGHNAILSTDITKKGESMFNSPRVIFSKGDVLGETPGEIINNTEFKQTEFILPTETQPTKKKKFKRGSKSKGIIDNLGENCK